MQLGIITDESDIEEVKTVARKIETEDDIATIETKEQKIDDRIFPGIEDPIVQKIIITGSFKAIGKIYTKIKSHLGEEDIQIKLNPSDIEELKWELIESETGITRDKLDVVESQEPEKTGGIWLFEFVNENGDKHQLKLYTEDLSFEHKEIK